MSDDENDEIEVYIRPKLCLKNMTAEEVRERKRIKQIQYNKNYYIKKRRRLDAVKEAYADILYVLQSNPTELDLDMWAGLYSAEHTLGVCSGLKLDGYEYDKDRCKMIKQLIPFTYKFGAVVGSCAEITKVTDNTYSSMF